MKENKIKKWFEEHKDKIGPEVIRITYFALGLTIGYIVSDKISDYRVGAGLNKICDNGLMKFFDPSTGNEIDIYKACEIAEQMLD